MRLKAGKVNPVPLSTHQLRTRGFCHLNDVPAFSHPIGESSMVMLESLTTALGTGIAKYLVKELLPTTLQDQISEEFVDLGLSLVKGKRHESDPVALAIGKHINSVYQYSKLEENEKTAVVFEATQTLALANTQPVHLVELNLEEERLFQELIKIRPEATAHFSTDEDALYKRMLKVASEGIIEASAETIGFLRAVSWGLLRRQENLAKGFASFESMQAKLWVGLAKLLTEPEEKAKAAEEKYRQHLIERLDRLEPFGIRQRDEVGQRLKLQAAFVKLKLTSHLTHKELTTKLRQWRDQNVHQSSEQLDEKINAKNLVDSELNPKEKIDPRILRWVELILDSSSDDSESLEDVLAKERRVMIEGLAGAGKSTILQWMAVKAAQRGFPTSMAAWNGLVPFFIRLRQTRADGFPAPGEWPYLEAKQVASLLPNGWVHEVLEKGNALVLIDGIDEMPQSQRGEMLKELRSLVHSYPLARYVVSSRPMATSENQWPEWRAWLREAGFVETEVKELEGEQLDSFVDQWHKALQQTVSRQEEINKIQQNAANLKQLLLKRTDLQKLATTPLLGAMICVLYQDREDKVPQERLELYDECVKMLLENRDTKKGVKLDTDYANISYKEKLILLQGLAYWMLDNTYSAVSGEEADVQFANRLPALDLQNISGKEVRRLFVERTGLVQEEIIDEISFRHRTFQEYLAAKEAIKNNSLGVLTKNVRDDQWRETIILAAGVARPDERITLLRGMLKKAANLKTVKYRHQIYLLALACLETCTELAPSIRKEVVFEARSVFPPHSSDEMSQIAKAGNYAVEFLPYDPDYPKEIAILCIQTLAEIGGEIALAKLADYRMDKRGSVQKALANTWSRFELNLFAERILQDKQELTLTEIPRDKNWSLVIPWITKLNLSESKISDFSFLENLSNLTQLDLSGTSISDLSPLANLSNLTQLDLSETNISDLSPLASLLNLTQVNLVWSEKVSDLSPLANLPNLTHLSLDIEHINCFSPATNLSLTHLSIGVNTWWDSNNQLSKGSFKGKGLTDLPDLSKLMRLSWLVLNIDDEIDVPHLPQLPFLSSLDLKGDGISDLSPLANLSNLTQLFLSGFFEIKISDLSPLANLSNLTRLSLDSEYISDLSPLVDLPNLTHLDLTAPLELTKISDLSPLANLSNLTQLSLSGKDISDLSPLINLPSLHQLSLGFHFSRDIEKELQTYINLMKSTSVRDIRPLLGKPSLRSLILHKGIPIPNLDALPRERGLAIYAGEQTALYRYIPPTKIQ